MPENDNETSSKSRRGKFNTSYTRRGDDIPSDANYEQIAEALIKDDLGWYTSVGATEHNGERLLTPKCIMPSESRGGPCWTIRREAPIPFSKSLQCVSCGEHGAAQTV